MQDALIASILAERGGRCQRMQFDRPSSSGEAMVDSKCEFVDALLFMYGWGTLSMPNVNWLARTAILAGAAHPELSLLAELGGGGLYPGNMRRGLLRAFCKECKVPRPLEIEVMAENKWQEVETSKQSIISLPEVLQSLWGQSRSRFDQMMGAKPRLFWEQLHRDDPRLSAMADLTSVPNWMDITYPCVLHGDAGAYAKKTQSSVLVVSLKSILADSFDDNISLVLFCRRIFVLVRGSKRRQFLCGMHIFMASMQLTMVHIRPKTTMVESGQLTVLNID